jgi:Tfp pilus assembly protein PilN
MGFAVTRSLGISLRNGDAFYVYLSKVAGRIRLLDCGSLRMPEAPAGIPAGAEPGPAAGEVSEGLPKNLLRRKPDAVILGLPRREAVLRPVDLPSLDDKDLASLLAYEIERHIPFPAEEACYHYQRVKQKGEKATLMLAACRRADLERHLEAVGRLGLQPTAVEVSALAALNALLYRRRTTSAEMVCLVVLDGKQAEVSAVRGGELLYSRGLAIPEDPFEPLRRELVRGMEEAGTSRSAVFVSGGSAELCQRLAEALGVAVKAWTPAEPPADAAAFGLALQGLTKLPLRLDLLPPERRPKLREPALAAMFALLALLAALSVAWGAGVVYRDRHALSELSARLVEAQAQAAKTEKLKAEYTKLVATAKSFGGMLMERTRSLAAIKELVSILPASVYLTDFTLEEGKLQIRGVTSGSASELIAAFERSSYFENAAFSSPISAQGSDRQGFQIQASIKGR